MHDVSIPPFSSYQLHIVKPSIYNETCQHGVPDTLSPFFVNSIRLRQWNFTDDIIGLVGIGRDITDKKNLEAEVLRAQRMESLGRLATGIAHDLNNTLAPVLISVELLRQKLQDADSLHVLAAIEASARRAGDTVKQVLSFSREAEGRRIPVNPCRLADGVVAITTQTLPQNIRIEKQIDFILPNAQSLLGGDREWAAVESTQWLPSPIATRHYG